MFWKDQKRGEVLHSGLHLFRTEWKVEPNLLMGQEYIFKTNGKYFSI